MRSVPAKKKTPNTKRPPAPADEHTQRAIAIGREMAAAVLELRNAALARRREAARALEVARITAAEMTGPAAVAKAAPEAPTVERIFAAGGGMARDVIVAE